MVVYIKDYNDSKAALKNHSNVTKKSNGASNSLRLEATQKSLARAKRRSW